MSDRNWERGTVVQSRAGRDEGYFLCVVGWADGSVLLCDGKERPLERPKKKNPRHVCRIEVPNMTWQFRGNDALRRALNREHEAYCAGRQVRKGGE